jgi:hypothetical protein
VEGQGMQTHSATSRIGIWQPLITYKQNALFPYSAYLEEKLVGSGHWRKLREELVEIRIVNDRN